MKRNESIGSSKRDDSTEQHRQQLAPPSQSQAQAQSQFPVPNAIPSPNQLSHSPSHSSFPSSWVNRVRRGSSNNANFLSSSPSNSSNRAISPNSPFPSFYNQDLDALKPISSSSSSPSSTNRGLNLNPSQSDPRRFKSSTSTPYSPSPSSLSNQPTSSSIFGSTSKQKESQSMAIGGTPAARGGGSSSSSVQQQQSNSNHHSKNNPSVSGSGSGLSRFFSIRKRKDSNQGNMTTTGSSNLSSITASGSTNQSQASFPSNNVNTNQDPRRRSIPFADSPPLAIIAGKGWGSGINRNEDKRFPLDSERSSNSKRASTGSSIRSDLKSNTTSPLQHQREILSTATTTASTTSHSSKRRGGSSKTPLGSPDPTGETTFSFPPRDTAQSVNQLNPADISRYQKASASPNSISSRTLSLSRAERDQQQSSSTSNPNQIRSNQYPPQTSAKSRSSNLPSLTTSSARYHQASHSVPLAQISTFSSSNISPASSPRFGKSPSTLPLEMDEELRNRTISEGPRRKGSFKRTKSISNRIGQLLSGVGSSSQVSSSGRTGSVKSGKSDESSRVLGKFGSKDDMTIETSPKKAKPRRPATADLLQPKRTKSPFSIAPSTAPLSFEPSTSNSRSSSPSLNPSRGHSRNHTAPSTGWFSSAPATKTEFGQLSPSISPSIPAKTSFTTSRKLSIKRIKPPKWLESPKVQEPSTPEIQSWKREGSKSIDNLRRDLGASDDDDLRLWSEEELNKEVFGIGRKKSNEELVSKFTAEEKGKMPEKTSTDSSSVAKSSINSQGFLQPTSNLDERVSLEHRIATPSHLGGSPLSTSAILKELDQGLPAEDREKRRTSVVSSSSKKESTSDSPRTIVHSLQGLGLYNYSEPSAAPPPKEEEEEPSSKPLPSLPESQTETVAPTQVKQLFPSAKSSTSRPTTPSNPKSQPSSNEPSPTSPLNLNRPRSNSSGTGTGSNSGSGGGSARGNKSAIDLLALVRNGRRRGGTDASLMSAGSSASRAGRPYSLISLSADDTPIMRLRKLVVDTGDNDQEEEEVRKLFFRAPGGGTGRVDGEEEAEDVRSSSAPLLSESPNLVVDPASRRRRSGSESSLLPRTSREPSISRITSSQPPNETPSKASTTSGFAPISPTASIALSDLPSESIHSSGSSTINAHKLLSERGFPRDQLVSSSSAGLSSRRSYPVKDLQINYQEPSPELDNASTEEKDQPRALTTDLPHRAGKHRRTGTNTSLSTVSGRGSMMSVSTDTGGEDSMSALEAEVGKATRSYVESARLGKGRAAEWATSKTTSPQESNTNVQKEASTATPSVGKRSSAQSFGQAISQGSSNASLAERARIHASAAPSSPPATVIGSESGSGPVVKETSSKFSLRSDPPDQLSELNESKSREDPMNDAARLGHSPSKRIRHSQSQPMNSSSLSTTESKLSGSRRKSPAKSKSASRLRTNVSRSNLNAFEMPTSSISAPVLGSRALRPSRSGNFSSQSSAQIQDQNQVPDSTSATSQYQDQTLSSMPSTRFNTSSTSGMSDKSSEHRQGNSPVEDLRRNNLERLFERETNETRQSIVATSEQSSGRTSAAASAAPTSSRASPTKRLQTFATSEEAALAKRKEQLDREKRAKEKAKEASRKREEKYAARKAADPLLARRLALVGLLAPTSSSSKQAKSATSETVSPKEALGLNLATKSSLSEMSRSSSRDSQSKKKSSLNEALTWDFKPPPSISKANNPFKPSIRATSPNSLTVPLASDTAKTPPQALKNLEFLGSSPSRSNSNETSPVRQRPNIYARSNASSFGMSQASFHTAVEAEGSEGSGSALRLSSASPVDFVSASEGNGKSRRSSLGVETVMGSPMFDGRRSVASDRTEQIRSFTPNSQVDESGSKSVEDDTEEAIDGEGSKFNRPSTSASIATLDLPSHFPQPPNRALKAQRSDDGTVLSRAGLRSSGSESQEDDGKHVHSRLKNSKSAQETSPSARFYNRSATVRRESSDEADQSKVGNVTPRSSPAKLAQLIQTQDPRSSMRASVQIPSEEETDPS